MKAVHICPILLRTVVFQDGKCRESCDEEDCPLVIKEVQIKSEDH